MGKVGKNSKVLGVNLSKELAAFVLTYGELRDWTPSKVIGNVLDMWDAGEREIDTRDEGYKAEARAKLLAGYTPKDLDKKKPTSTANKSTGTARKRTRSRQPKAGGQNAA